MHSLSRIRSPGPVVLCALTLLATAAVIALPARAPAESASQPASAESAGLDAGAHHTCAVLVGGAVSCWGFNGDGQLGYGNTRTVGDDEPPGSAGNVDLGGGRAATAVTAGDFHTCAVLDDGAVSCWGLGGDGQLGYGNRDRVGDDEAPGSAGPVDLDPGPGFGRAKAISAGEYHTCAVLDDGRVRCWGLGEDGQLGYGNRDRVGDDEAPGSAGPVDLDPGPGFGRARAISAASRRTCAVRDDGSVLCWGFGREGDLGYRNQTTVGDTETPGSVGPVDLGGQAAVAVSVGRRHTCAVLDDGSVRCWGYGFYGQLGYGNTRYVGDDETPGSAGPVDLDPGPGVGRAVAISAGDYHTCARLDDRSVRCWGQGANGRLGYGATGNIGDDETPGSVGPVDLGLGNGSAAISDGGRHTCAQLDDGGVRCWGYGATGRLGYCGESDVGDDEAPASAGPVDFGTAGSGCTSLGGMGAGTGPEGGGVLNGGYSGLQVPASQPLPSRGPGPILGLRARAASKSKIRLRFYAAGSDGSRPPAASSYLIRQSLRPIRTARDFARSRSLCDGRCRFPVSKVGTKIVLTVTALRPRTTYYYAVAARDGDARRVGPRSKTVKARTR